jgi:hypothetical protein
MPEEPRRHQANGEEVGKYEAPVRVEHSVTLRDPGCSVTLQLHDGSAETIETTPSTSISESRASDVASTTSGVTPSVVNGDEVAVTLDPADSTPTASSITVILDRISGRVVKVEGSTVRVAGRSGDRDFLTTPATEVSQGAAAAPATTSIANGDLVTAFGTPTATVPSELVADFVDIDIGGGTPAVGPAVPGPARVSPSPATPRPPAGGSRNTANPGATVRTPATPAPAALTTPTSAGPNFGSRSGDGPDGGTSSPGGSVNPGEGSPRGGPGHRDDR